MTHLSEELRALIDEQRLDQLESSRSGAHVPYADVKVEVCSALDASEFSSDQPWACISIASREGEWPELADENRVALLQLAFSDVETPVSSDDGRSFSASDAREVIDFVMEHSPKIQHLLIHCERGESRSAGVAAAIAPLFGINPNQFNQGRQSPNALVYSLLSENIPPIGGDYDDEH